MAADRLAADAGDGVSARPLRVCGLPVAAFPTLADVLGAVLPELAAGRDRPFLVTFANPGSLRAGAREPAYAAALEAFDLVLPDGIGLSAAAGFLHGGEVARVSFDSTALAPPVLAAVADRGLPLALVGGRPGVARRAGERLQAQFPDLALAGFWDGYRPDGEIVDGLLAAGARVVVCGMGLGRQEALLLRLAAAGWTGCGFTCGGWFDQLADGFRYYPAWVDRANLRWAFRLYREPGRLWRRYLVDYGYFLGRLAAAGLAAPRVRVEAARLPAGPDVPWHKGVPR